MSQHNQIEDLRVWIGLGELYSSAVANVCMDACTLPCICLNSRSHDLLACIEYPKTCSLIAVKSRGGVDPNIAETQTPSLQFLS